jgi:hypothetical protein
MRMTAVLLVTMALGGLTGCRRRPAAPPPPPAETVAPATEAPVREPPAQRRRPLSPPPSEVALVPLVPPPSPTASRRPISAPAPSAPRREISSAPSDDRSGPARREPLWRQRQRNF